MWSLKQIVAHSRPVAVLGGAVVVLAACAAAARCAPPDKPAADQNARCILVYKVDEKKADWRPDRMDSLLAAIRRRINPSGVPDITVQARGTNIVEIVMPFVRGSSPAVSQARIEEIRKRICTTGALEFRIVATRRSDQSIIEAATAARKASWERSPSSDSDKGRVFPDPDTGKKKLAEWCRVREKEADRIKEDAAAIKLSDGKDRDGTDRSHVEILVLAPENAARDVTGEDIRDARCNAAPEPGEWEIDVTLSNAGARKFGVLTGEHLPLDSGEFKFKLAIVMDGVLITAPSLMSQISDRFRITSHFDKREAEELAEILSAGSLPAVLDPTPVSETIEKAGSIASPSAGKPPKNGPRHN
jgi:SecD/SecF fusion protein